MTKTPLLLLCAAPLLFFAGCKEKPKAAAPPVEVAVVAAVEGEIQEYVTAIGDAKADEAVNLVARVEGYLIKRNFTEGQMVKKGTLLYEIEPVIYAADVKAAEAAVQKAKATQRNANIDFERQKKLIRQDAVSERAFDDATAKKMEADAEVESAEAALAIARQRLTYTKIIAPFDGWVGISAVSVGNLVELNTGTLTSVQKIDPMRIEFVITEPDLLRVIKDRQDEKTDPKIRVRLFLQNGEEYGEKGHIAYWNNQINTRTGTIKLQALFDNKKQSLVPGMFLRIRLEPEQKTKGLLIPTIALMNDQAGEYVYVVETDGTVKRHTIKTGFKSELQAVVMENLKPGDQVIVGGLQKVRPGSKAKPVIDDRFRPDVLAAKATPKVTAEATDKGKAEATAKVTESAPKVTEQPKAEAKVEAKPAAGAAK